MSETLANVERITGLCGDIPTPNTEEIAIGKYYDGRTIYRRYYTFMTPSTADTPTNVVQLPSDAVILRIDGIVGSFGQGYFPVNFCQSAASHIALWDRGNGYLGMEVGSNRVSSGCGAIIEYVHKLN